MAILRRVLVLPRTMLLALLGTSVALLLRVDLRASMALLLRRLASLALLICFLWASMASAALALLWVCCCLLPC